MTVLPASEIRALDRAAVDGARLLELGNKKNRSGLYRDWYEARGVHYWSTDINGEDGAFPWDIRTAIPKEISDIAPFDCVTNFGFTEHVQTQQEDCWRNIHRLVHPAFGQLSCVLPQPGHWLTHGIPSGFPGRWYPHPAFFTEFAKGNGYAVDDLWVDDGAHLVCCRMHRLPGWTQPAVYFPEHLLFDNTTTFEGELKW